jgi:ATP-dependent Clp protease ATP-binding subunit ClpA
MHDLDGKLLEKLVSWGISVIPVSEDTLVFQNVPIDSIFFNKETTSVLIRFIRGWKKYIVCVDEDLEYTGPDDHKKKMFRIPEVNSGWRPILLHRLPSDVSDAITDTLETLEFEHIPHLSRSNRRAHDLQPSGDDIEGETLRTYAIDLTRRALLNQLSPTVGRQAEIDLLLALLRKREHPRMSLIIGSPGSGKSNLIHGVTFRLLNHENPLQVLSLDLIGLVLDCSLPGDRDSRLLDAFREMSINRDSVFVIENINTLVSLCPESILLLCRALDAKQKLIGTANHRLTKSFQNPLIRRRLFRISLAEPDPSLTMKILHALKPSLEDHHGIAISNEAIRYCVIRSDSWPGSFPEKAIALLDLACAQLSLRNGETLSPDDIIETAMICSSSAYSPGDDTPASRFD